MAHLPSPILLGLRVVVPLLGHIVRSPNAAIVHEILIHCNSFISCPFIHEHRNFNLEIHNLAKFTCNLGVGRHAWLGNPHD
uniref:Secreted protein n=1 Tax=Aegilops tauschii subsp. strangulata TaxID=200361 RepID=A0A453D9X3_AEGTS